MNKGYILIINVLLLSTITAIIILGVINPILSRYTSAKESVESKRAFILANSAIDEAVYRLKNSKQLNASTTITLSANTASIDTTNTTAGKDITVTMPSNPYQRNIKVSLALGTGISFHYGIQSGRGGFVLNNSSSVTGNIFSSGTITGSGNYIYGDIISSGSTGSISGIHATGTAFAHTITNSTIDKDAYYVSKTNTTVSGTSYPNSPDQSDAELPISDEQITTWESDAEAGGTASCSSGKYTISSSVSIGPKKIPCDLVIKGVGIVVTITGPIWATGNIDTQNSPIVKIDPALGNQNVAIIADNPSNRTTSSIITLGQNTSFQGSGTIGSYVFMISQNNSSEGGGSVNAINVGQSSNALVGYASHGQVSLSQSVSLKEITAYKIILSNTSNVTYDTGLANSLFSAGPGGGYNLLEWKEI
jgi:hypothetical protein